ncbi:MAG TPA: serine hydrolase, partial [Mucilaginibacter sp.]|nr:serine hydrolase [Mucilaginibacter sp.]
TPILNKPGSKFLYNTMATFMLSAIVQQVTGQKVLDYLEPRLFEPLGITGEDWEASNQGINTGGWGLRLKTGDMAKLGMLYLHKGMWNGKQLLPEAWVNEATTFKIDQAPGVPQSKKDSSDWMQGYCYQFWRCRHNAFRADGAFGQYIIVMPDQDAVIAVTSETADMQGELNLVWQYLLPAMHNAPLPTKTTVDDALAQHLQELNLPPLSGAAASGNTSFSGHLTFQPNKDSLKQLDLNFANGACHAKIQAGTQTYNIDFGNGKWLSGATNWPGPYLLSGAKENFSLLQPLKIDGSYAFTDPNTLVLKLRYIESPHSRIITLHLDGKNLSGTEENSFTYGKNKTELTGAAQ